MDNKWIEHPSLKNMDPRKKQVIAELMQEAEGKPMQQCLPSLIKANQTLQAQGLSFTQDESTVIMGLLTKDLPPQEIARIEMMRNMINNMSPKAKGSNKNATNNTMRNAMNAMSAMNNRGGGGNGNGNGKMNTRNNPFAKKK